MKQAFHIIHLTQKRALKSVDFIIFRRQVSWLNIL